MIMSSIEDWNKWLEDKPEIVREIGAKINPLSRYRIKETGQGCRLRSIFEDGTLSVFVGGPDDGFIYVVFGLSVDDIEELSDGQS